MTPEQIRKTREFDESLRREQEATEERERQRRLQEDEDGVQQMVSVLLLSPEIRGMNDANIARSVRVMGSD